MKNVNCPVCIWEFLHYSSASLVPAAPSPWQLPAPCSHTHTHTIKMHTHTHTNKHTLTPFFRLCRRNGLDDWLTLWPLSPRCVCAIVCVCFIDIRETYNAHACLLSVWGLWAAGGRTHAHVGLCFYICEDHRWHDALPSPSSWNVTSRLHRETPMQTTTLADLYPNSKPTRNPRAAVSKSIIK